MRNSLVLISFLYILVGSVVAQQTNAPALETEWTSPPFPDVVMCRKRVEPVVVQGNTITQRASYESINPYEEGSFYCGWIELKYSVGAKKATELRRESVWYPRINFRGYDAWRGIPKCRTSPCSERIEIFLTDNQVVTLIGDCGRNAVLNSGQSADFRTMSAYIEHLRQHE